MAAIGGYIRGMKPIMLDIQAEASRSVSRKTKTNLLTSNRQVERSIRSLRGIYNHLARNVDKFA